jgi:hypothetical protein
MTRRSRRSLGVLIVVTLIFAVLVGIRGVRESIMRTAGRALVVEEPIVPADIIVVSAYAGGAGVLEAADLVQRGIAKRVAVFADPPDLVDREFLRRGLPYEDGEARSIRQLKALGITDIAQVPRAEGGTEAELEVLPRWCDFHGFRSVVVVTMRDHSRRVRRILQRTMQGHQTKIMVHPEKYSQFDPDHWWKTRDGIRTELIELQKLLLDLILHPSLETARPHAAVPIHWSICCAANYPRLLNV